MVEKLRTSVTAMREQANGRHIPFALLAFIKVLFSNVKPKRKFDSLMTTISDLVPGCQIALLERQANEHLRIIQTSGLIDNTRFKTALPQFIEGEWYFLPNVQEERVWQEHYTDCFPECQSALAAKFHTAKNHYLLLIMQPTLDGFNHPQRDELYALFDVTKSALYSMLQFRKPVIDKHQVQPEEKFASLCQFASGVAPEITNPLGFVMSNFSI
ncbi:hypothetical protein, partial [Aeromonas veronii]|uniref:hypothetical protein n=1 Tax=Aeromonas veronii TaxID=654 RepID=UPI003F668FDA